MTSEDLAPQASEPRESKSDATRRLIVSTSMKLFTERGYDRTTMRAIAAEAGLSVGNAYYYFASKEHLIQGVYDQIQRDHQRAARELFATETQLGPRVAGVLRTWVQVAEPYREFGAQLFKTASDPSSPLNPFSPESRATRDAAVALMHEAVVGSTASVDRRLVDRLPEILWLMQMGMVLFWVYDHSPGSERTLVLVDRVVPIVVRLLRLSRLPILRSTTRELIALLDLLRRVPPPSHDAAP